MNIEDFPNYQIHRDGNVENIKTGRILKPGKNSDNYYGVCLYNNGKKKSFKICRLLAKAFIPNPENKPEVDHINKTTTDDRIENLRWVNRSEQMINTGLRKDNILRKKYITYHKQHKVYRFRIERLKIYKSFKTLQEAIDYRDSVKEAMEKQKAHITI